MTRRMHEEVRNIYIILAPFLTGDRDHSELLGVDIKI
jgi:hypothetical protein